MVSRSAIASRLHVVGLPPVAQLAEPPVGLLDVAFIVLVGLDLLVDLRGPVPSGR